MRTLRVGRLSAGLVAALVLLVTVAHSGCSAEKSPAERVAEAAADSEAFYSQQVRSYRFRSALSWGPRETMHPRDPRKRGEFIYQTTTDGEFVIPDRLAVTVRSYEILAGEPEKRYAVRGCPEISDAQELVYVGSKNYEKQCDGSWLVRELESESLDLDELAVIEGYWDKVKRLEGVQKVEQESVRDVAADVYQGEFVDDNGDPHRISVWVGREDNLIRKLKDEWPLYSLEVELYDINDSAIVIEEPQ